MAAVLATVLQPPVPAQAGTIPPSLEVAPTCTKAGVPTRIVILGRNWTNQTVKLALDNAGVLTDMGTVNPGAKRPGAFSFVATVTPVLKMRVRATQGSSTAAADLNAQTGDCRPRLTASPVCLRSQGSVALDGAGFFQLSPVGIEVDPNGAAEAENQFVNTDQSGAFRLSVVLPTPTGPIPIIARQYSPFNRFAAAQVGLPTAVAFVDPCPPDTTQTTPRPVIPPGPTTTTTTRPVPGGTTTTSTPRGDPTIPPITVPEISAQVSYSPRTVRPGRCVVLVVSAAPPGLPVVARFADGPPVNGQTGPTGGTVLSLCHSHDSGIRLGPVPILLGIGPVALKPVFTVLRVPARPQPPLLQSGADGRRS